MMEDVIKLSAEDLRLVEQHRQRIDRAVLDLGSLRLAYFEEEQKALAQAHAAQENLRRCVADLGSKYLDGISGTEYQFCADQGVFRRAGKETDE